jgi:hypothetical protein
MSLHFYECKPQEEPKFLPSITTVSKARGKEYVYPSVTTVLGAYVDPFMLDWQKKEMYRIHPGSMTYEDAKEGLYGYRTCPDSGSEIPSSEFGTNAHHRMELWADGHTLGGSSYDDLLEDAIGKFRVMNAVPIEAEVIMCSQEDECAGTVDLIAEVDGKFELFDYKFRDCNGKSKTYDKDLEQLAIESLWVQEHFNLDYLPRITTVCVCSNTGKAWFKKWKEERQSKGILSFRGLRQMLKTKLGWEI